MNYSEVIDYLYASQPVFHIVGSSAYKPGLANTYRLMEHLCNPHQGLHFVHVAGTNGKGSTSHLLAAVLQAAGYKVGLYTSPHLVDFRERIRVNGAMISEQAVIRFVEENRAILEEIKPSFFETTMAMAFSYFAEQQVDIAVVEVGLGGRLDSTNIITPLVSVITNIGLDHTELLGNNLSAIASEKAGIIKPNVPCVIGETQSETAPVFISRASECDILGAGLESTNCKIWFADQCGYLRSRRLREVPQCQLQGIYQEKNMQTAYVALQVLAHYSPFRISSEAIAYGFANVCDMTGLRGRWEIVEHNPLVICDTGHNSHGIRYVSEQLQRTMASAESGAVLRIVFGMVNDKDVDVVLQMMPSEAVYYFTQAHTHRAIAASDLQALWRSLHTTNSEIDNSRAYASVAEAVRAVKLDAGKDDVIFVGGSNYVVGEMLSCWQLL